LPVQEAPTMAAIELISSSICRNTPPTWVAAPQPVGDLRRRGDRYPAANSQPAAIAPSRRPNAHHEVFPGSNAGRLIFSLLSRISSAPRRRPDPDNRSCSSDIGCRPRVFHPRRLIAFLFKRSEARRASSGRLRCRFRILHPFAKFLKMVTSANGLSLPAESSGRFRAAALNSCSSKT